jgi:hypothetical protein
MKSCANPNCPMTNPQPLDHFHKRSSASGLHQPRCKTCRGVQSKIDYSNDIEEAKARSKRYSKKYPERRRGASLCKYWPGCGWEQALINYQNLLIKQGHKCALCHKHYDDCSRGLWVDHCHDTGRVRGLLCSPCNTAIGFLKNDINLITRLINYLDPDPR